MSLFTTGLVLSACYKSRGKKSEKPSQVRSHTSLTRFPRLFSHHRRCPRATRSSPSSTTRRYEGGRKERDKKIYFFLFFFFKSKIKNHMLTLHSLSPSLSPGHAPHRLGPHHVHGPPRRVSRADGRLRQELCRQSPLPILCVFLPSLPPLFSLSIFLFPSFSLSVFLLACRFARLPPAYLPSLPPSLPPTTETRDRSDGQEEVEGERSLRLGTPMDGIHSCVFMRACRKRKEE